jgi:hypothetical protein
VIDQIDHGSLEVRGEGHSTAATRARLVERIAQLEGRR